MFRNRFFITIIFILILVLLFSPINFSPLNAQDLSNLRGMKKEEILELLGPPSRIGQINQNSNSQTLYFGSSQILLINDSVASWIDTGELDKRYSLAKPAKKDTWEKWTNPWTPPTN